MLSDDALLVIFDFYVDGIQVTKKGVEAWQTLIHVCQRWRSVIFGSPRRLNLQLFCTAGTPVRDTLDVWPPLPLLIRGGDQAMPGMDNIIAALERSDRVCQITLEHVTSSQLEEIYATMQEPFPELTHLQLRAYDESAIRSWAHLPHVCDISIWTAFRFRDYQNYSYLPLTSLLFTSGIFLIPGTFHPIRWPLASPP